MKKVAKILGIVVGIVAGTLFVEMTLGVAGALGMALGILGTATVYRIRDNRRVGKKFHWPSKHEMILAISILVPAMISIFRFIEALEEGVVLLGSVFFTAAWMFGVVAIDILVCKFALHQSWKEAIRLGAKNEKVVS